ncbi:carbamoyl-phosphate synthase (glutamine-hydrolyzing) large subunit [Clostridium sp. 19966]|uniref:carbamoyl-phosphate synthase (glutamine-hydrolyzing) large subunit n=1 Tax=Clostridium sp. 19966 TaxID=2768166 RepID=UPI0028DDCB91|nr:carbamoyl-phosphate synthase (glutamine-hydrolyzing) large subunit [Clostridium sp. 19966]MDT8719378.1 carbamoyl-phosphate synthase (glutamine-hydrolyzing) large subunit [Clostridium sp. 19966]
MALDKTLNKVLIIGSGPIIIGQAAEFDYSGTQACKAIKEEGIETILVNSNPATIMTDKDIADKVYIEPITVESIEKVIEKERPDGVLAGFGGQTALNLAMKLKHEGILEKYNVKLLGINSEAIKKAEDREEFKKLMLEINQPVPKSIIATHIDECIEFVNKHGFPVIIRPAYTLGGTGGGIAENMEELHTICSRGIEMSPIGQILLEQSVAGWKEIEYEVIRDGKDNCIIICNMENIDPVGIHTGDSIVVAPSQTLRDTEYQMLRKASIDIIRSLKIEGGCNVQFALDPKSNNYIVIEVNPRVSRSSALASKATGYPIAKIAAKIAIGYSLDELKNTVTGVSSACFEPTLDYVVVKIPKWPFDKFTRAERILGTQMKATGEVMAISRSFESALLKAVTSLEGKAKGLRYQKLADMSGHELMDKLNMKDDERIFAIAEALRRNLTENSIFNLTQIDPWFINSIKSIVDMEKRLMNFKKDENIIYEAQEMGFTDDEICDLTGLSDEELKLIRAEGKIYPVYKMVDTCSGEFEAATPYYYSCYDQEDEAEVSDNKKILMIGSGPIRIGQGIEFDYCCVHGVWAIKEAGYESIIINNNPETVSTDFDTSDRLYFEPLYIDDVMNVINKEKPEGVIVQFGGQTALNLAEKLSERDVKIIGTQFESIDLAEDREKFRLLLEELDIPSPKGIAVKSIGEAKKEAGRLGYPVVVRPSYVIGGRAMEVINEDASLERYMKEAMEIGNDHPILMDKYIRGTEIEVDAISDGEDILIPGIMEHVERTGVHSGDSITIYPYVTLNKETVDKIKEYTYVISKALKVKGLINIQLVFDGKDVYIIEVNPRASRTVPILSKVTDIPMISIAVQVMLGKKLRDLPYGTGLKDYRRLHAVKVPIFSGEKLADADMYLGPEMKSTGEVLGLDDDLDAAIYKAFSASGIKIATEGNVYVSLKDYDKEEALNIIEKCVSFGFNIIASAGTYKYLKENGIECSEVDIENAVKYINAGKINMIINTPTRGNNIDTSGFKLRRKAAEHRIPVFTCIDTFDIYMTAVTMKKNNKHVEPKDLNYYKNNI